jgi:hypothetical protein
MVDGVSACSGDPSEAAEPPGGGVEAGSGEMATMVLKQDDHGDEISNDDPSDNKRE